MSGLGVTVGSGLPSAVPKQCCPRSGGDTVSGRGRQQGSWEGTLDSASQTCSSAIFLLHPPTPPLPPYPHPHLRLRPPQTVSKDSTGIPKAQQALFSGIEEIHHFGTARQARSRVSNEKKAAAAAQPGSVHVLSGHCQVGPPPTKTSPAPPTALPALAFILNL